jgi:hypothetical protein
MEDKKWIPTVLYGDNDPDTIVRVLRAWKMNNKTEFMNEIGAALQFFEGFGENWHAVKDCLCNLYDDKAFKRYIIVVTKADELFSSSPNELEWFIKTIVETSEYYSKQIRDGDIFDRPPVRFELVLECTDTAKITEVISRYYKSPNQSVK